MHSFAEFVLFFSIYSFAGWALETVYALFVQKRLVKRGFLFGCFCPIYGCGAIVGLASFSIAGRVCGGWLPAQLGLGAALSAVLFSALEFAAGALLLRLFGRRYWDYSDLPFNFHGFICLKYTIIWGVIGTVFFLFVHPLVAPLVLGLPLAMKNGLAALLGSYFVVDTAASAIRTRGGLSGLERYLR